MKKVNQRIDALLLVGGFSGSGYLFKRVEVGDEFQRKKCSEFDFLCAQELFGGRVRVIARPSDADTATARGAAQYGLARRPLVSSVVAPRSYMMKVGGGWLLWHAYVYSLVAHLIRIQVKLPAEREDFMKRPAYVSVNNAGVPICENRWNHSGPPMISEMNVSHRLQYLVAKGAILRKGFVCIISFPFDLARSSPTQPEDQDKVLVSVNTFRWERNWSCWKVNIHKRNTVGKWWDFEKKVVHVDFFFSL
jgi:hypothetical protein